MAAGLPVIASPVGANREIVRPNETGFLPENPTEWSQAIAELAGDATKRQALGAAGRRRVEEHFSIEIAADLWASLLRGDTLPIHNSLPSVAKE
jgi:glycosyltransferase involved in cell wall biosynthesis